MTDLNVERIVEIAREGVLREVSLPDGRRFVLVPPDFRMENVSDPAQVFAPAPPRIRQAVSITAKDSFTEYVRTFAGDGTRIFADLGGGRFVAALDYHPGPTVASRLEHTATFSLQTSEEWKRWSDIDKKLMKQAEFARWLEENLADIDQPSGADVLEVVRDMSARKNVNFASAIRLQNGDTAFEYTEETKAQSKSGMLEVPTMFVLRIPVFYGEPAVEQRAFLRYNIDGGTLAIGIELHRPAYVKQAVFEAIGRDIAEQTGRPVHYGQIR